MYFIQYFIALLLLIGGCQNYSDQQKQRELRIIIHYNGRYEFKGPAELKIYVMAPTSDGGPSVIDFTSVAISRLPAIATFAKMPPNVRGDYFLEGHIVAPSDPVQFITRNQSGAETKTLVFWAHEDLGSGYGRDASGIYAGHEKLKDCDPNSFQVFPDEYFGRDSRRVYHGAELIEGADPASFEILTQQYQRDNRRAYYLGEPVPGAVGSDFEIVGDVGGYGRDKTSVFEFGDLVPNLDAGSFTVLSRAFTKDKNGVYLYNKPVAGADIISFHALGRYSEYAADNFRAYYHDRLIQTADPTKLRVLGKNIEGEFVAEVYATDEVSVFFEGNVISGADPETFQVIQASYGESWYGPRFRAKDKNRTYSEGAVESTP